MREIAFCFVPGVGSVCPGKGDSRRVLGCPGNVAAEGQVTTLKVDSKPFWRFAPTESYAV